MPDDPFKLYKFIEFHVKNVGQRYPFSQQSNSDAEPRGEGVERRDGTDRRKGKYIPAQVKIKLEDAELTAIGHTANATQSNTSSTVSATGAYVPKN
jgi:hypothetical protein